jgi:hypothetical protein
METKDEKINEIVDVVDSVNYNDLEFMWLYIL